MFKSTGNPTISKFRSRLNRINECAETGRDLAIRWNPKGRNAEVQRQLIRYFTDTAKISAMLDEVLKGRRI